jgi:HSP20 family molecular chaperone IbpA
MVWLPVRPDSPHAGTELPVKMDMDTSEQEVNSDDWILAPVKLINTLTLNTEKRGRKRARQRKSDKESSDSDHADDGVPKKRLFEKPYEMFQNVLTFANEELEAPGWILRPFRLLTRTLMDKTRIPRKRGTLSLEAPETSQETIPKKHLFEVEIDVTGYNPQDLTVRTSVDSMIIAGRHEETQMHAATEGNSIKQFTNTVKLPANVIRDQLECKLTSNGTKLSITAPLRNAPPEPDRTIPINMS